MKPGLLFFVCALLLVAGLPASARASPWPAEREESDLDEEPAPRAVRSLAGSSGRHDVLGAGPGTTYVSVVGFSQTTLDDRREIGGLVLVGLPLDRFVQGSRRATVPAPPLVFASSVQRASAGEQPFDLALTPRLARSAVAAAWRAAGLGADDSRLDAIVSRAHWSAVLPEARIRVIRWDDTRLSLDTYTSDTNRLTDSAGARIGFEGRLTWRLDRLVYADDEPAFERLRLEQRDARTRVAAKVFEALFQWQRAALDLRSLPPTQQGTRDEADVRLRLLEAEAVLDVLTNGWFGTQSGIQRPRSPPAATYAVPVPVGRGGEL